MSMSRSPPRSSICGNLFADVCEELHVPIANFKGWSDLNSRAAMMRRFAEHEAEERRCVLLRCAAITIRADCRSRMRCARTWRTSAARWGGRRIIWSSRFGLNADFIDEHGLTWIDNLETSSGGQLDDPNHNDHWQDYVQDYIAEFGVRKCEANALVVEPDIGRQLCRNAILEHIPADAAERYQRKLDRLRLKLRRALRERVA